jgi:hypothetical protein
MDDREIPMLGWDAGGRLIHEGQLGAPTDPIRRAAGGQWAAWKYAKRCEGCDVVFVPKREDQRYHSPACKQKAYRARRRQAKAG